MTTASTVIFGLYHHAIDINRSYAPVAATAAEMLQDAGMNAADCVSGEQLPPGVRAVFSYYGRIPFAPDGAANRCRFRIERSHAGLMPAGMIGTPLSRPHTDEVFYISAVKGRQFGRFITLDLRTRSRSFNSLVNETAPSVVSTYACATS